MDYQGNFQLKDTAQVRAFVDDTLNLPLAPDVREKTVEEFARVVLPETLQSERSAPLDRQSIPTFAAHRFLDFDQTDIGAELSRRCAFKSELRKIALEAEASLSSGAERDSLLSHAKSFTRQARDHWLEAEIKENSPAYRQDVESIFYELSTPGFRLNMEIDPYTGSHYIPNMLRDFELSFNPDSLRNPLHLLRRTFGSTRLHYDMQDVRFVSNATFLDEPRNGGEAVEIYLKGHPNDPGRNENGPLLMVLRNFGKLRIWPAFDEGSILGHVSVFFAEMQSCWTNSWNMGRWYTATDVEATVKV